VPEREYLNRVFDDPEVEMVTHRCEQESPDFSQARAVGSYTDAWMRTQ